MIEKTLVKATYLKNEKTKIVAQFAEYKGTMSLNIRQHVLGRGKGDVFVPTPAGFNIPNDKDDLERAKIFFTKVIRLIDQKLGE